LSGNTEVLNFYSCPGKITSPGEYGTLFDALPHSVPQLCEVVQGLIIHRDWAPHMGLTLTRERVQETNLRTLRRLIGRMLELENSPLTVKRPTEKRVVGTCRDFSTFFAAMLRHKGIPARARCGFGGYFSSKWEDHWVCEYWKKDESRWVMVDAQLDQFQRTALKPGFDVMDMPPGKFLIGGDAWQKCRRGQAEPEQFGIFDMHGLWFIAGNVVRDLLSLNRVELLPWDIWHVMNRWGPGLPFSKEDTAWLDHLAEVTMGGDAGCDEVRYLYQLDPRLKPPTGWPDGTFDR